MPSLIRLEGLQTEERNPKSHDIDQVDTIELCQILNDEDATVAGAVHKCIPVIAEAIDALAPLVHKGGRVVYVGAGTSGRLGVLDASEIPPTYSASSEQFVALIAGGDIALRHAQEGAEDDVSAAENDLKALALNSDRDSLIGIAASGRTPYVLSCLEFAKSLGCKTIGIACCHPSAMSQSGNVDYMISVVTGPEVVTGSTRLKAGTGTKLVLNMISTGIMIKVGKTFGNMMIDLKATNKKLQQRSRNIIRTLCGPSNPKSDEELDHILETCNGSVKLAVVTILLQISAREGTERLEAAGGVLAKVLKQNNTIMPIFTEANGTSFNDFVLCIDGGGSKCAAVLLGPDQQEGKGEAGECNVSSVGISSAVSSISFAVQRAVDSCAATKGRPFRSIRFKAIWVGLAGYDRPRVADTVDSALVQLFKRSINDGLKISTDLELLVRPSAIKDRLDSVIVLVVGTGSVAMSYKRYGNQFIRTGRSGGWGNLLGDDGSGYGIGREGLRLALESADELNLTRETDQNMRDVNPLVQKIFRHFEIDMESGNPVNLLDRILTSDHVSQQDASTTKRKISGVSKIVLDESLGNDNAKTIVEAGSQSLVRILSLLVDNQQINPSNSALILAGGLMHNEVYQSMILEGLKSSGKQFGQVQAVAEPAVNAARYLLKELADASVDLRSI